MTRKVAKIPVRWIMSGIVEIPYSIPEELASLIQQINMPKGSAIPDSFSLDTESIETLNKKEEILKDIFLALEDLSNA